MLISWNCGVSLFLGLIYSWMMRLRAEVIRTHYVDEDQSAEFILVVVVLAG